MMNYIWGFFLISSVICALLTGRTAELYVMLAGIHWKNTEAIVNGRTLTKVTAREGLYFTEGYLELEEGILVKINPSAESVIKIQKK